MPADVRPDIAMERIMQAYQTGEIIQEQDDDHFVEDVYENDNMMMLNDEDDDEEEYDDNAVSDLITKLRESAKKEDAKNKAATADETETTFQADSSDEDLDDDAIERHLKLLTGGIKKKMRPSALVSDSSSSDDDSDEDMESSEDESDDSDESDDDDIEADYTQVDDFMKKLGIDSSMQTESNKSVVEDRRKWLESLSTQAAPSDYQASPMTVAAKKKWLADLATDIIQHVSDDEESDHEEDQAIEEKAKVYEVNVKELEEAAQKAQKIIQNMDEEVIKKTPPPKMSDFQRRRNHFNSQKAVKPQLRPTPPQKTQPPEAPKKTEEKVVLKPTQPIEKTEVPMNDSGPSVELKETVIEEKKEVEKPDYSVKPSDFKKMKDESHALDDTVKKDFKIVIPPGYPPYPGYGPKWPWHPTSPQAPPGYKDCYMHYMGKAYFEYMKYLEDYSLKIHNEKKAADQSVPEKTEGNVEKAEKVTPETKEPAKPERVAVVKTGKTHSKFEKGRGKVVTMSASERKLQEKAKSSASLSKKSSSKTMGVDEQPTKQSKVPTAPAADQGCACVIL